MPTLILLFFRDFILSMLLSAMLGFFSLSVSSVIKKSFKIDIPVFLSLSIGIIAFVSIELIASLAGCTFIVETVPWLLLLCEIIGGYIFFKERLITTSFSKAQHIIYVVFLFSFCLLLIDVPGLPAMLDGIAATTYFMRIIEFKTIFIPHIELSLGQYFGREYFEYYPTGSHAMAYVVGMPLIKIFNIAPVVILRIVLIISSACSLSVMAFLAQRWIPRFSWWASIIVAFMFFDPTFFPVINIAYGMYPLAVAMSVFLPLCTLGLLNKKNQRLMLFLSPIILPISYFFHPAICIFTYIAFGAMVVSLILSEWQNLLLKWWRIGICLLCGFSLTLGLVYISFSSKVFKVTDSFYGLNRSFQERGKFLIYTLAEISHFNFMLNFILLLFSIAMLIATRKQKISKFILFYNIFSVFILCFFLFISVTNTRISGLSLVFYNEAHRVAMIMMCPGILLYAWGLSKLIRTWRKINKGSWCRYKAFIEKLFLYTVIIIMIDRVVYSYIRVRDIIFVERVTDRMSRVNPLLEWIKNSTPINSVIIKEPRDFDIIEGMTWRKTLLVLNECPTDLNYQNCKKKIALLQKVRNGVLKHIFNGITEPCANETIIIKEPVFLLVDITGYGDRQYHLPAINPCSNWKREFFENNLVVYKYMRNN